MLGYGTGPATPKAAWAGKAPDRLSFTAVQEPAPLLPGATLALLALPVAEPQPWSHPSLASPEAPTTKLETGPVTTVRKDEVVGRRAVAVLPPVRPATQTIEEALSPTRVAAAAGGPYRLFSLALPGTERLASGTDALRHLGTLGRVAASEGIGAAKLVGGRLDALGDDVAEALGLR